MVLGRAEDVQLRHQLPVFHFVKVESIRRAIWLIRKSLEVKAAA